MTRDQALDRLLEIATEVVIVAEAGEGGEP
jgi:hypothetical protein